MAVDERLSDVEQHALLAVWRLRDEAYGAAIRDELRRCTGRDVTIGAIYSTLVRLEKRGLVDSRIGEPSGEPGGKGRRLFHLLPDGVAALEHARAQLERLWEGLRNAPESRG